jgi:hypothetical protein
MFTWMNKPKQFISRRLYDLRRRQKIIRNAKAKPNADVGAYSQIVVGCLGFLYKIYFEEMQYRAVLWKI